MTLPDPTPLYRVRDGVYAADLLIAAPSQRLWEAAVAAMDAPALATDARFATVGLRSRNLKALEVELDAVLSRQDVAYWIDRFTRAGVPVTRVSGLEEAVASGIADELGVSAETLRRRTEDPA